MKVELPVLMLLKDLRSCVLSWSRRFEEPIELPDGRMLKTLAEAMAWLAKEIPKSEHKTEKLKNAAGSAPRPALNGGPPARDATSGHPRAVAAARPTGWRKNPNRWRAITRLGATVQVARQHRRVPHFAANRASTSSTADEPRRRNILALALLVDHPLRCGDLDVTYALMATSRRRRNRRHRNTGRNIAGVFQPIKYRQGYAGL